MSVSSYCLNTSTVMGRGYVPMKRRASFSLWVSQDRWVQLSHHVPQCSNHVHIPHGEGPDRPRRPPRLFWLSTIPEWATPSTIGVLRKEVKRLLNRQSEATRIIWIVFVDVCSRNLYPASLS